MKLVANISDLFALRTSLNAKHEQKYRSPITAQYFVTVQAPYGRFDAPLDSWAETDVRDIENVLSQGVAYYVILWCSSEHTTPVAAYCFNNPKTLQTSTYAYQSLLAEQQRARERLLAENEALKQEIAVIKKEKEEAIQLVKELMAFVQIELPKRKWDEAASFMAIVSKRLFPDLVTMINNIGTMNG